jgi:hypothetical protein
MEMRTRAHELSPTTHRGALQLARYYCGSPSIEAFASSITLGGVVLDVGAGRSTLGEMVTAVRPDIQWFNIDSRPLMYEQIGNRSQSIQADARALPFPDESVELAVSFGLFNHLSLEEDTPAFMASMEMLRVAKSGGRGRVLLGPIHGREQAGEYIKQSGDELSEIARMMVAATRLGAAERRLMRAQNRAGSRVFGQGTNWKPRSNSMESRYRHLLPDPATGKLVNTLSPRGLSLRSRYAAHTMLNLVFDP